MPELPDLEVYTSNLRKLFLHKKLLSFKVDNIFRVSAVEKDFERELAGQELKSIERFGKEIYFSFANERYFSVHLMLNGKFQHLDSKEKISAIKKRCATLEFENGSHLVVSDPGDYCKIRLNEPRRLAPDAFGDEFSPSFLHKKLRSRRTMLIKAFLIDQKIVQGIGNAYADEILYDCRIAPHSECSHIPDEKVEDLYVSIKSVLSEAIESIKAHDPDTINGEYRDFLKVHVKGRLTTDSGAAIIVKQIANKKTYFTKEQVFYGSPSLF